ncbi:RNP domain-containingprotein [Purpureocillium lavendulum]|uniref:RNP domain-containingprotein n=1 Tax=Purpureocillium lavendulum TaxID=1247861 RepID=A0AB34G2E6_9HYPO|nr:RNP domain-containingprotein [Purpureocillium lavendulum]
MAYRAPPGTSSSSNNSLPARPPAPAGGNGFKPAFGTASAYPPGAAASASASAQYGPSSSHYAAQSSQYGAPPAASARYAPGAGQYGASPTTYASYPGSSAVSSAAGPQGGGGGYSSYPGHAPQQQHYQQQQQTQSYGPQASAYGASYSAAPQIQNPFPAPGTGYDISEAAQIAEWQSAYSATPQLGKDGKPVAGSATDSPRPDAATAAAAANSNPDKKKTVVRSGGGKTWTDDSLLEWDPSHMRIFVGNLAGETTDESLLKAFSRWKSVQKARVIRDKRTTKSKGYGFVSFADADDFFQAAKEMNGKYIQSHPVVVKKANTDIKSSNARDRGRGGYHNKGGKNKNKSGNYSGGGGGAYEPSLGPAPGAGVTKPGQKTKNGLRLLG